MNKNWGQGVHIFPVLIKFRETGKKSKAESASML